MAGIFESERRTLTEEQFAEKVNGTQLSYAEMQYLRKDCGLPPDQDFVFVEVMPERLVALAWRKIKKPCLVPHSVPPI